MKNKQKQKDDAWEECKKTINSALQVYCKMTYMAYRKYKQKCKEIDEE
jgi:hypothetical protein